MMPLPTARPSHLIDRLPRPRGRLTADAPLGQQTWFRTGGPAEVLFRPADVSDLSDFLEALPGDVVVCLGAGNITAWAHALPGQLQQLAAEKAGPRAVANDPGSAA
jgi:UDP-N-acetylmuramate dehydrogenase